MAALFFPKASPAQPAERSPGYFIEPSVSSDLKYVSAVMFACELTVAVLPSALARAPPFWAKKASTRSWVAPTGRPTWPPVVSFLATFARSAQFFGTSASVRPALVQSAVLMNRARVETSFGAQTSFESTVKDLTNVG